MKTKETVDNENTIPENDAPLYEIIIQDEFNVLYMIGFYNSLDDAVEDINDFLDIYDEDGVILLKKGDLKECTSDLVMSFDREVEWKDKENCPGSVMIRGFILSAKSVGEEANRVLAAHAKVAKKKEKEK